MTSRRPPDANLTLSPSDVATSPARGTLRVGGRVLERHGSRLLVGDALGRITVTLAAATTKTGSVAAASRVAPSGAPGSVRNALTDVSVGDHVVVRGRRSGRALRDAVVVERAPGLAPAAGNETTRFTLDGVGVRLASLARALSAVRTFFDDRGFVEVETPVRVPSPGLDAHVDAIPAEGGFLITSPELHMKRLLAGGLPRIYQVARVSRAEELGLLHEPEFTLVEWYRAFAGVETVIRDTEALIAAVVRLLAHGTSVHLSGRSVDVTPPFARLTVRDAFRAHAGIDDAVSLAERDPDRYFQTFVDAVEPALARHPSALLLHEFPLSQAALARPCPHDPTVAERFEIYVAGVELCNGFGELTDPVLQRQRFEQELERRKRDGSPLQPIDEDFLAALREGLPPCAGNALGLARLVALALGTTDIASVTAFPARKT